MGNDGEGNWLTQIQWENGFKLSLFVSLS